MGESIAAILYINAGSLILFALAIKLSHGIVARQTMVTWAGLWVLTTTVMFLSPNFWVFAFLAFLIGWYGRKKLPGNDGLLLFIVLMFAAPNLVTRLPGFAGINTLLDLTPQRILALAILVPAMPQLLRMEVPNRLRIVDKLVILITILVTVLSYRHYEASITDTVRRGISHSLDIAVPYFVFSRCLTSAADLRKSYVAFVFGTLPFPVIGILEFLRQWRMYNPVAERWGAELIQSYLFREGMLRAAGPAIEAIAFGFVCMIGAGCALIYLSRERRSLLSYILIGALSVGLVVSLSRGPWVGAAVMLAVYMVARPKAISATMRSVLLGGVLLVPLLMSPLGDGILRYLPFVGTVENNNVEYRQALIDNSMAIIGRYPFFGSANFLTEPEMLSMRQGQGIIDVVNTYVALALEFGLVTLAIFAAIFLITGLAGYRLARRPGPLGDMARIWVALLAGTLVTIATVSSVSYIPLIYWILAGLGVAIARVAVAASVEDVPSATRPAEPRSGLRVIGAGAYARSTPTSGDLAGATDMRG
ncbi:O-antigen ligase family protein [Aureimonas frigidaquae]|uniref:O-antigen ligase n=1 Tax=Aureimonas frigidaquae TaxID=424757 RepID=A0A0P0Z2F9_9HYPH|nr:O-antigen ligase family protein [Aureimonas frigidaquae]BAT28255.1 O-antigen ligase [Aureimonas frigidaquae]